MFRNIITSILTIASITLTAQAQNEKPDTLAVYDQTDKVTIDVNSRGDRSVTVTKRQGSKTTRHTYTTGSSGNGSPIIDSPRGWDIGRLLNSRRQHHDNRPRSYTSGMMDIYAGGTIPVGSHGAITGGWEIGIKNIICGVWSAGKKRPSISLGAGLGWRMQTVGHGTRLDLVEGRLLVLPAFDHTFNLRNSIRTFHFTVPVKVVIPTSDSFALALAAELHLNTYTTASSSYDITDELSHKTHHIKSSFKGLHQSIATVDYTATIGWREALAVYVTFSPMHPWKGGYGPQYKTLSVGGVINF